MPWVPQAADYFRRTLAELHEKGSAAATNGPERMTLDEALANIDTWEQGLKERIQGFKVGFGLPGSVCFGLQMLCPHMPSPET